MKKVEEKETKKTTKKVVKKATNTKTVKEKPIKEEVKEECCTSSDKECNCTNKNKKLIIIIIVLLLVALTEGGILIVKYIKGDNSKIKNTKWFNYIEYGNDKIKQEFEFTKDGKFIYNNVNGDEKSEPLEGEYKEYDDFTVLYVTSEDGKNRADYFLYTYDDYLCLSRNCDEFDRFYKSDDKRAKEFKSYDNYLENMQNTSQQENEDEEDKNVNAEPEYIEVSKPTIYIFHGETCPHCIELFDWLKDFKYEKGYELVKYEVWNNQENATLMSKVADYLGYESAGVPFVVIGGTTIIGFNKNKTPDEIKQALDTAYENIQNKKYYDVIKTVQK